MTKLILYSYITVKKLEVDLTLKKSSQFQSGSMHLLLPWLQPLSHQGFQQNRLQMKYNYIFVPQRDGTLPIFMYYIT